MKENVLEVLMYLFDHYLEMEHGDLGDEAILADELLDAGFATGEINKAFNWLGELAEMEVLTESACHTNSLRILIEEERHKLDLEAQGYLIFLEQEGLITPTLREIILDRAMAIEGDQLKLSQFKRVVGLVIMNQSVREDLQAWAENLIYDDIGGLMQ
jgi:Smg protein